MQGLTLSWQSSLTYRNQSTDFQSKLMDWFLYDRKKLDLAKCCTAKALFCKSDCNIWDVYKILLQFPFTSTKIKLNTQYQKLHNGVASRVAKRRKLRKQGNIRKISKLHGGAAQCTASSIKMFYVHQPLKNTQTIDIKAFRFCLTLLDFLIFLKIFCAARLQLI